MSKIIFVTGPSGMAKTKVKEKFENLAKPLGIQFQRVIATVSRDMRPNENQGDPWFFKSAAEIKTNHNKNPERYLQVEVRKGELQGLDTETQLKNKLKITDVLWCELHIKWLKEIEKWIKDNAPSTEIIKIFIAPLTEAEVLVRMAKENATWENVIEEEMLRRLIARKIANLDNATLDKLQERAKNAVYQYALRSQFDCIIVNHQGEESAQWGGVSEFPIGEAAQVMEQFFRIYIS